MIKDSTKNIPERISCYVNQNWGSPFILGFMTLLLIASGSLSLDFVALADSVATVAYYVLVVGVILQVICYLKYNKKSDEKNYDSS